MNLQVLPARTSEREVKKIMKGWAKQLGVACEHCHDTADFAKDTEHKDEARAMLRMVNELNTKHLAPYGVTIDCAMCHRGRAHPPELPAAGER